MKKRLLALFLAVVLVSLAACTAANVEEPKGSEQETVETPSETVAPTDAQNPEQTAAWAQWEPALPADMGLCAATSGNTMAETESGYYLCVGETLYYADKSDLTNWVVVCNMPECSHRGSTCPARVGFEFYLEDGRIWSARDLQRMSGEDKIDLDTRDRVGVYSMGLDGTDLRREYVMKGGVGDGASSYFLTKGKVYGAFSLLENDGSYRNSIVVADSTGTTVLKESTSQDRKEALVGPGGLYGEPTLFSSLWEDNDYPVLRNTANGLEKIPGISALDGYYKYGACLEGDTLVHFVQDDGYYRINLTDGTSEKGMSAQLSGSRACWLGCGYVVEGNFFGGEFFDTPEIRIYDGRQWKNVTLPEDFYLSPDDTMGILAISTEAIFFRLNRLTKTDYGTSVSAEVYMVPLNSETYTMTFCESFLEY